ncbi:FAD-dependent oxidoreductase [Streptomyces albireticuli]|nr:FAD-dependent oxidoreductase [Streptomyces albireticuli]
MERVLVIGHGMAGARLASELSRRDPELSVTILGEEPQEPYNRILLTDVLAGTTDESELGLTDERNAAEIRPGVRALRIDRERATVSAGDGRTYDYDVLVLATGSTPRLPPVKGLISDDGGLAPGIAVFHTLDDCRRILRLARDCSRAVVLGGGLLGLETARALALRGVEVEVLHAVDTVMERHLDAEASSMLIGQLAGLGVAVRTGCAVTRTVGSGRLTGVQLDDGEVVPCDLLVVSCGAKPETAVAEAAGLPVGRGVLVDARMRTADPAVYAIGDCAERDGALHGLVAEAWEHARVAADAIAGPLDEPPAVAPAATTRLKADGIELTVVGESNVPAGPAGEGPEVLTSVDRDGGVYRRVALRDGRIVGAVLLGGVEAEADRIVELFAAGSVVPAAERPALVRPGAAEESGRAAGPDPDATVCYCNNVPRKKILEAWSQGAVTVAAVARRTKASTGCGICRSKVKALIESASAEA